MGLAEAAGSCKHEWAGLWTLERQATESMGSYMGRPLDPAWTGHLTLHGQATGLGLGRPLDPAPTDSPVTGLNLEQGQGSTWTKDRLNFDKGQCHMAQPGSGTGLNLEQAQCSA